MVHSASCSLLFYSLPVECYTHTHNRTAKLEFICGFKLLENVPEEELVEAAMKQIAKCHTNLVFANDLAELRKGNASRLVVTQNGYNGIKVDGAYGIFNLVKIATEN